MQEKVHDLYDLDDSYEIIPVRGQAGVDHTSASTSAGHTMTTSNQNPYYARRTLVDSIAFMPQTRRDGNQQCDNSAQKKQTLSG